MTTSRVAADPHHVPPGSVRRGRRPRVHYELVACGLQGHALVGTDAATVTTGDALLVRESEGLRWHRCLRCDGWFPLRPPTAPARDTVPGRDAITLPLRGRPLRDRFVLRLIAIDRLLHVVVLGLAAAGVFLFMADREALRGPFFAVLDALQNTLGPTGTNGGLLGEASRAFSASTTTLLLVGLAVAGYALLEGVEAVGLWWGRRWAEYLTFVATALLLLPEIYELSSTVTVTKVVAFVVNVAVVVYLLFAKRLFGIRGGGRAEAAAHEHDSGWAAIERTAPGGSPG